MKKYILALSVLAVGLVACSDEWDNHYEVKKQSNGTLWENIAAQTDLTQFSRLLDATGFRTSLNGSQVFTVFAPTDDVFSATECDSLIQLYNEQLADGLKNEYNAVLKEFVMNHVALYNYSVSPYTNDSIVMMNGKYKVLSDTSLSDAKILSGNQLCSNGVLFKLGHRSTYAPSIYEYIKRDHDLDSLAAFYRHYEHYEFDPEQSVPGGIKDGKTVYLDSVRVLTNSLLSLASQISREDSSFVAIYPTNALWKELLEKYERCFVYDKKVEIRDSLSYILPRLQILESTVFSRSFNSEDKLDQEMRSLNSIMLLLARSHTYYFTYYARALYIWKSAVSALFPGEIKETEDKGNYVTWSCKKPSVVDFLLDGAVKEECSNGVIYKHTDRWPFDSLFFENTKITMQAESAYAKDSVYSKFTKPLSYIYVADNNPLKSEVSGDGYVEVSPRASQMPKALFNVYNVLSNVNYDVYVVTAPPIAGDTLAQPLNNNFRVVLMWNDMDGKQQQKKLPTKSTAYFESDGSSVTRHYLGNFSFPTSSFGLDKPQVKIQIEGYTNPSLVKKGTHTTTTGIDCFEFIPTGFTEPEAGGN